MVTAPFADIKGSTKLVEDLDPRARGFIRIQADDVKLFFEVEGSILRPDGPAMRQVPTLLLLHGGPGFDHSGFKPAFTEMTTVVQVGSISICAATDAATRDRRINGLWSNARRTFIRFARRCRSRTQLCWVIHWAAS
jgi:hypothetical protein